MPKLSDEAMQDRRMQIIAAARRVFAAKGLSKVTLRDVFREAGMSAGAVYNYFQSKDDLILAVTEAGMAEALAAFAPTDGGNLTLQELVELFFRKLESMDPAEAPRVDLMIAAEGLGNADVLRVVSKNRKAVRLALQRVIEQQQANGSDWQGHPASTIADLLYATYQGVIVSIALGEKPDIAGVASALTAMNSR